MHIFRSSTPQKPKPSKVETFLSKKWVSETSDPFFSVGFWLRLSHPRIWSLVRLGGGFFSWAESLNALFSLRFNTRATKYLAKSGWHAFFHWYDYMSLFAEIGVVWRWLLDDIAWPFYAILCSFSEISVPRTHRYILLHAGTKHPKALHIICTNE